MYFHLISYAQNTTSGKLIYYYKCETFEVSTKLVKMFKEVVKECSLVGNIKFYEITLMCEHKNI